VNVAIDVKSSTPALEGSTHIEQCSVIRRLVAERIKRCEICRGTLVQYGSSYINHTSFYSWIEKSVNGRKIVDIEQLSGRPDEVSTPVLKTNVEKTILANRRVTIEDISLKFGASLDTIRKIIRDDLYFRKTRAKLSFPTYKANRRRIR